MLPQPITALTRQTVAKASRLDPTAAAVARQALQDPHLLDDHLEQLEVAGFGDPDLDGLAKEIIRLRLEADVLDTDALQRHLAARGFGALISEIDKAARKSSAPFLDPDFPLPAARTQWTQADEALIRVAALERALSSAKAEMTEASGAGALMRLKAERDALRRAITSGTIWETTGS
jgi:DNA primase